MALTREKQRELLELVRQQARYRRESRSPLRQLGGREDDAIAGFGWSGDGDLHLSLVERLAVTYGDRQAIALLKEVAGAAEEPKNIRTGKMTRSWRPQSWTKCPRRSVS